MGSSLTLELPEPPSANRWWRNVNGRMVTSREARTYKQMVANRLFVLRAKPIAAPTPCRIVLTWYRGRKAGDLDKRLGVLLDALQGAAYDNDGQVTQIHATREDDPRNPRIVVTITPLTPTEAAA